MSAERECLRCFREAGPRLVSAAEPCRSAGRLNRNNIFDDLALMIGPRRAQPRITLAQICGLAVKRNVELALGQTADHLASCRLTFIDDRWDLHLVFFGGIGDDCQVGFGQNSSDTDTLADLSAASATAIGRASSDPSRLS